MNKKYTFRHADSELTTVKAKTEKEARRLAMVKKHGARPDSVTPDAPNYSGYGLSLVSID